jgi:hypothetical protein
MRDVNLLYFWSQGRIVFAICFVLSGILIRHLILRRQTRGSPGSCIVANAAMSAASWLFVVELPVPIIAWGALHIYILDRFPTGRADPISWMSVLVLSALVAAVAEAVALRAYFGQELRAGLGLLFAVDLCCVTGAAYIAVKYVLAHPVIA